MNTLQLYINDQLADLAEDSPVALTFQINNLAEVKNQQGNTSNQFKLPLTQRNRRILGFPDEVAFTTGLPYDNYRARIIQDGLEIVPDGIAVLNGVEESSAAITVLSGNVDFFDSIDLKLYDAGDMFAGHDHAWTVANIASSQTKTEGWIWPVVDYGTINYPADNISLDVHQMRPGIFLKSAIEAVVKKAGYKITPDSFLLKQSLYNKLIVQFANDNFEHGTVYQNAPDIGGVTATLAQRLEVAHPTTANPRGVISFTNTDGSSLYNGGTGRYTANAVTKVSITVKIPSLYFYGKFAGDYASNLDISIIYTDPLNGELVLDSRNFNLKEDIKFTDSSGIFKPWAYRNFSEPITLSAEPDLPIGGQLRVAYEFKGYTGSKFSVPAESQLIIKANNKQVLYGQAIQCERIFPDITMKDLLKDTLQRFGIICQTDNTTRTVTFASFRDIVNNIPIAKDWTRKCLDQGKTIAFQLGGYAQVNTMKYKDDEAIVPKDLGNAQISVKDKTLSPTADLVESQFAPTLNRPFVGGHIAQVLKVDVANDAETVEFTIATQPRILIDQKLDLRQTGGASIKFTDGTAANDKVVNDVISVPYFYKPNGEHSLLWDDLRKLYYPELEKMLQQTKKVVRYFMLTPRDILELDLLIPVYLEQDSAYYYINKIDSWRKGQPVKVELVKLG